jgi:hypothetical protein
MDYLELPHVVTVEFISHGERLDEMPTAVVSKNDDNQPQAMNDVK